jgi:hypothetical protein
VLAFQELIRVPEPPTFFVPFWCSAPFTEVVLYPEWQLPQFGALERWWVFAPLVGGMAWQLPQFRVASTLPFRWVARLTEVAV